MSPYDIQGWSKWTRRLLLLAAFLAVVQLLCFANQAYVLEKLANHAYAGLRDKALADLRASGQAVKLSSFPHLLVFFSAFLSFLIWLYRAVANAQATSPERMLTSPRMAVGWFFVPLSNLVLPFLVIGELLHASQPDPSLGRAGRGFRWSWWGGVILSQLAYLVALAIAQPPVTLTGLLAADLWMLLGASCSAISSFSLARLVGCVTDLQSAQTGALLEAPFVERYE